MPELIVHAQYEGERIDRLVARETNLSRSAVQSALRTGHVRCNGKEVRGSHLIRAGDRIDIETNSPAGIVIEAPSLNLLYQDDDVLVIDKPAGIAVHPGSGVRVSTLVDAIRPLTSDTDPERPGIVHRLDRDTSGVMIVAKTPEAKAWLAKQFADRRTEKHYLALVVGRPSTETAVIRLPLARSVRDRTRRAPSTNGKEAETRYRIAEAYPGFTLVEAEPKTGRTHQLRAHFAAIGHPIAGDVRYGAPSRQPSGIARQFLHAVSLGVTLPNGEWRVFTAPLAPDLEQLLNQLRLSV